MENYNIDAWLLLIGVHWDDIKYVCIIYAFLNTLSTNLCVSDYREAYYSSLDKNVQLFRDISDWQNELKRTLCSDEIRKGWRLSMVNAKFQLCPR